MARPIDRNDVKNTPTSTEDSSERGFAPERDNAPEPASYQDFGQSDRLDFDDEGDIADEGRGHRG